jgi:hypothetical protein
MEHFTGFAELRNVTDLFRKLEQDLVRVLESPLNEYAAFDFFVRAERIVDWKFPHDQDARKALRTNEPLLRITSHIANGAKHFKATRQVAALLYTSDHHTLPNVERHSAGDEANVAKFEWHEELLI